MLLTILPELAPEAKLLLKATILLSYLAWVGELRVAKVRGQWRAYLRWPYYLLAVSLLWGLLELLWLTWAPERPALPQHRWPRPFRSSRPLPSRLLRGSARLTIVDTFSALSHSK